MKESRKWEDLNTDILIQVFEKVDTQTLITGIQFVCKLWFRASSNPQCWKNLDFQSIPFFTHKSDVSNLILSTVFRSRTVNRVVFPRRFDSEALSYILEICFPLKSLAFPVVPFSFMQEEGSRKIIRGAKNLEEIELGYCSTENFIEILREVSLHCKYFVSLILSSDTDRCINKSEAAAIVDLVPKIKYLILRRCRLSRENLILILGGCHQLVKLDVRDCQGFEAADKEIQIKASGIETFMSQGSALKRRR
ncbi:hypothetical protein ACHQM5_027617 [Ranunculus cassubicifolius]